jgi:hypothetical protein
MKLLKFVVTISAAILVVSLLGFVCAANFSAVESHFQCTGKLYDDGEWHSATVYIELEENRWWVWWRESDGALKLQLPDTSIDHYGYTARKGNQYHILVSSNNDIKGSLSNLTMKLAVDTSEGRFEGVCNSPKGH